MLSAHLIIFWLSLDSNITPPVAMGPFAAAAIAQADPMKTGWACFRFAKIIYVMPLLFAYTHILLTGTPAQNIAAIASATLGIVLFSDHQHGFLLRAARIYSSGCFWPPPLSWHSFRPFRPASPPLSFSARSILWQRKRAANQSPPATAVEPAVK